MLKGLEFAELLTAKLCHDLSGGISAISLSVEFMDDPDMQAKARDLMNSSSIELMAKLRCYRYAYGMNSQDGETDLANIRSMVEDYFRTSRINLMWDQDCTASFIALTHKSCKVLVNMILTASSTMIYGGDLHVKLFNQDNKRIMKVIAEGKKAVKTLPEFEAILENQDNQAMNVNNIQIHLLAKTAYSIGMPITATITEDKCILLAEVGKR